MAVDIKWYVEDQIIFAKVYGKSTSEDLVRMDTVISHLMRETGSEKLHLIFDGTELKAVDITVSQSLYTLSYLRHPKMGSTLVYGLNDATKAIYTMINTVVNNLTRNDFHTFKTRTECLQYLQKIDRRLIAQETVTTASVSAK